MTFSVGKMRARLTILFIIAGAVCCSARSVNHVFDFQKPTITICKGAEGSDQAGEEFNMGDEWSELRRDGQFPYSCRCVTEGEIYFGGRADAASLCRLKGCTASTGPGKNVFVPPNKNQNGCNCIPGNNPGRIDGPADLFHCSRETVFQAQPVMMLNPEPVAVWVKHEPVIEPEPSM